MSRPAGASDLPSLSIGAFVKITCKSFQPIKPSRAAVILWLTSLSPVPNCTKATGRFNSNPNARRASSRDSASSFLKRETGEVKTASLRFDVGPKSYDRAISPGSIITSIIAACKPKIKRCGFFCHKPRRTHTSFSDGFEFLTAITPG